MGDGSQLRAVSLAAGGLYDPFRDEESARTWVRREHPQHAYDVLPLTKVGSEDAHVAAFGTKTYSD